jgi:hypothetical protein
MPRTPTRIRYFVQLACFCQSAVFQEGQALSLTGIVGQVAFTSTASLSEPSAGLAFRVGLKFVLSVGPVPPGHPHTASFNLSFVAPDGSVTGRGVAEMAFQKGAGYGIVILDAVLTVSQPGIHWMNVKSGRAWLTRVPLNVVYRDAESAPARASASPPVQPPAGPPQQAEAAPEQPRTLTQ